MGRSSRWTRDNHEVLLTTDSYRADAGYNHDPSYISHSHSWSSGPTSSLIYSLLGLRVEQESDGHVYHLRPEVDGVDIMSAEGGFEIAGGVTSAEWAWDGSRKVWTAKVESDANQAGRWLLSIPKAYGRLAGVTTDDRDIPFETSEGHYILETLGGGQHTIRAKFA